MRRLIGEELRDIYVRACGQRYPQGIMHFRAEISPSLPLAGYSVVQVREFSRNLVDIVCSTLYMCRKLVGEISPADGITLLLRGCLTEC